jgi:protein-S-isoprenylcysteine O-methyltransferase Ste14
MMNFVRTLPIGILVLACLSASSQALPWFFAAYAALLWLVPATVHTLLARLQPELLAERLRPPTDRDRGTRFASMGLFLLMLVLAGVELGQVGPTRFGPSLHLVGFGLCLTGLALVGWTLLANPYASTAVRIQDDRSQRVVTGGPYALVRHPMYLGVLLVACGSPLALGSLWAWGPVLVVLALFARRTLFEDALLQKQLPGYAEYARRVRWRVLPLLF